MKSNTDNNIKAELSKKYFFLNTDDRQYFQYNLFYKTSQS